MFPERIDKMILDGVQNPHEYSRALAYVASISLGLSRQVLTI